MSENFGLLGVLIDRSAETAILGGLYKYGESAYYDIADLLNEQTFSIDEYRDLYLCIKHAIKNDIKDIDVSTLHSVAKELDKNHLFTNKNNVNLINTIRQVDIERDNLRKLAIKLKKLTIARQLSVKLLNARDRLHEITGSEPLNEILALVEKEIFNFTSNIDDGEGTIKIGDHIADYIKQVSKNPVDQVGIPTGFPVWDKAIGGGLRPATVNVIGARIKQGKSIFSQNIGLNIAKQNIPVLTLDTEMTKEEHFSRLIAMENEIGIGDVETGQFINSPYQNQKVKDSIVLLQNLPYNYHCINGKKFEEHLAIMRRWITQYVGVYADGTAKPCVIVYDYLKLTNREDLNRQLAEHQMLGFVVTQLQTFANKYKIPILAPTQLNRDGIQNENSAVVSQSDRILWFCSNFTILKEKSDEELEEDGPENGNRKLVVVLCRHGPGLESNEYINLHTKLWCASIKEGRSNFENEGESTDDGSIKF